MATIVPIAFNPVTPASATRTLGAIRSFEIPSPHKQLAPPTSPRQFHSNMKHTQSSSNSQEPRCWRWSPPYPSRLSRYSSLSDALGGDPPPPLYSQFTPSCEASSPWITPDPYGFEAYTAVQGWPSVLDDVPSYDEAATVQGPSTGQGQLSPLESASTTHEQTHSRDANEGEPVTPPIAPRTQRYRVPLPKGTATLCDPITVHGVVGLQCWRATNHRARKSSRTISPYIRENVDGVEECMDAAFARPEVYVHRGVFACDPAPAYVFNSTSRKAPQQDFRRVHLLTMMAEKQYKAWFGNKSRDANGTLDLQDLVGADLVPERGTRVTWGMVYMVAVRRWKDRYREYHYFPELEIRVS
ncbi:hypothetical protein BC628DRAFT_417906 [Trametes gibbosa]|nr:hypothetical protein BC628DRAFT_417906 [Trametes gibbosa]